MKYNRNTAKKEVAPTYPSTCGSHASMLSDKHSDFNESGSIVICEDARGPYMTERKCLDNNMVDGNRIATDIVRLYRMGQFEDIQTNQAGSFDWEAQTFSEYLAKTEK